MNRATFLVASLLAVGAMTGVALAADPYAGARR